MEITKGVRTAAPKVVIYGPEGIGKSTLASKFPSPLFIDLERGTSRLDVSRVELGENPAFMQIGAVFAELQKDPQGFRTVVIDTADYMEQMATKAVCDENNKKGIEDFGYGKGYTYLKERLGEFLEKVNRFQAKTGMAVVFIAHAVQRKFELPENTGGYAHYELKLSKQAAPLFKEWSDFLLFIRYDVTTSTVDGKVKATGGSRVVCTNHTPYWDAKSRAELPDKFTLDDKGVKMILKAAFGSGQPKPAEEPPKAEEPRSNSPADLGVKKDPEPPEDVVTSDDEVHGNVGCNVPADAEAFEGQRELIRKVEDWMAACGFSMKDLEIATVNAGIRPAGTPLANFNRKDLERIIAGADKIANYITKHKGA
ncbi:MAG: ATP-binding protein [Bacteroidales bacterium]|nr:ATP-binding protein [Bacteroidales bacterium]